MAGIQITVDISQLRMMQAFLLEIPKQMPYVASRTLNDAAKQVAEDLNKSTLRYFNKGGPPTRFTQNAYRVSSRSSKTNLTAEISPRPIQERYLLPSIRGGVRPQRPSERRLGGIAEAYRPGRDAKLNASGNMSKAATVKILQDVADREQYGGSARNAGSSSTQFTLRDRQGKLRPGVYQRLKKGGVKSVLSFNKLPSIPRRWPIERIARESIGKSWGPLINRYMMEALRTAKR